MDCRLTMILTCDSCDFIYRTCAPCHLLGLPVSKVNYRAYCSHAHSWLGFPECCVPLQDTEAAVRILLHSNSIVMADEDRASIRTAWGL